MSLFHHKLSHSCPHKPIPKGRDSMRLKIVTTRAVIAETTVCLPMSPTDISEKEFMDSFSYSVVPFFADYEF
jgi:hypothetical protein